MEVEAGRKIQIEAEAGAQFFINGSGSSSNKNFKVEAEVEAKKNFLYIEKEVVQNFGASTSLFQIMVPLTNLMAC